MKKLFPLLTCIALLVMTGCKKEQAPIRLAFIAGMNPQFNTELYQPLLANHPDITWKAYTNEASQEIFKPEHADEYDVIVFYDICLDSFPLPARTDLERVVKEKGKPVFILHDGLLTYNTWPEFARIAGMKYFMSPQEMDGVIYNVSTYKHNQYMPMQVADKTHPITQGMDNEFVFVDEIYNGLWKAPDIHPLWTTTHPDSEEVVMYTHRYGKAKVVGIVTGHGPDIFKDKNFCLAFYNGIKWLVD